MVVFSRDEMKQWDFANQLGNMQGFVFSSATFVIEIEFIEHWMA